MSHTQEETHLFPPGSLGIWIAGNLPFPCPLLFPCGRLVNAFMQTKLHYSQFFLLSHAVSSIFWRVHHPGCMWELNQQPYGHSTEVPPQPLQLHVIHQEVPGLHQSLDLPQKLCLLLSVLAGLVCVCSRVHISTCKRVCQCGWDWIINIKCCVWSCPDEHAVLSFLWRQSIKLFHSWRMGVKLIQKKISVLLRRNNCTFHAVLFQSETFFKDNLFFFYCNCKPQSNAAFLTVSIQHLPLIVQQIPPCCFSWQRDVWTRQEAAAETSMSPSPRVRHHRRAVPGADTNLWSSLFSLVISLQSWMSSILWDMMENIYSALTLTYSRSTLRSQCMGSSHSISLHMFR